MRRRTLLLLLASTLVLVMAAVGLHRLQDPTATVRLRLVDTAQRPLSGVELAFYDYEVRGTTGPDGVAVLEVPYAIPHYAELRRPPGYAFLGDGMIVSVCQPEVSFTVVLRKQ